MPRGLKRLLAGAAIALLAAGAAGEELRFHVHGLAFSSDGKALLAATERGLIAYREGAWTRMRGPAYDLRALSVTAEALIASGYRKSGNPPAEPLGFVRSRDGGATWQPALLAGEAAFHVAAAGHRSRMLYFFSPRPLPRLPATGLYAARDDGRSWERVAARGLDGWVLGLAAHPQDGMTVAAATTTGLFLSRDGGARFRRLARGGVVSAVAFGGANLYYVYAYSRTLVAASLDGRQRRHIELPAAWTDVVDRIAENPADPRQIAIATRWQDVYLSINAGATWDRIAASGREPGEDDEDPGRSGP
jgi:hypothetical protein